MAHKDKGTTTGGRYFGECGATGRRLRKRSALPSESYHLRQLPVSGGRTPGRVRR